MDMRRNLWFSWVPVLLCAWVGLRWLPSAAFRAEGSEWLRGTERQHELARSVNAGLPDVRAATFSTGAELFDGEWAFGTSVMAAIGNAQLALQAPEARESSLSATDRALSRATSWEIRAFDRDRWGVDPLDDPARDNAHVAYLGYVNLALSLRSALGASPHDALGERITDRLVAAYESSPGLLLETYPGEYYPVDNAMAIASIALRARVEAARMDDAQGGSSQRAARRAAIAKRSAIARRWVAKVRRCYLDSSSGLLLQSSQPQPLDEPSSGLPRGSGTALAAFALNYVDDGLADELQRALRENLLDPVLGFGLLREYPASVAWSERHADIDSGPLVLGYSISASGFMVGASRAQGDAETFESLMATFEMLGGAERMQRKDGAYRSFVSGGALADAIMLAMLTAPPHERIDALLRQAPQEVP